MAYRINNSKSISQTAQIYRINNWNFSLILTCQFKQIDLSNERLKIYLSNCSKIYRLNNYNLFSRTYLFANNWNCQTIIFSQTDYLLLYAPWKFDCVMLDRFEVSLLEKPWVKKCWLERTKRIDRHRGGLIRPLPLARDCSVPNFCSPLTFTPNPNPNHNPRSAM